MGEWEEDLEQPELEEKRVYRRPEVVELGHVRDLMKGEGVEMPRPE